MALVAHRHRLVSSSRLFHIQFNSCKRVDFICSNNIYMSMSYIAL